MSNWIDEMDLEKNTQFQVYLCATFPHSTKQLKITKSPTRENFEHTRKRFGPRRKNFEPMKYPRENILDPRNINEKKFWTQEIPTKIFPYTRKHDGDQRNQKWYATHDI